jgi:hypothetical protein
MNFSARHRPWTNWRIVFLRCQARWNSSKCILCRITLILCRITGKLGRITDFFCRITEILRRITCFPCLINKKCPSAAYQKGISGTKSAIKYHPAEQSHLSQHQLHAGSPIFRIKHTYLSQNHKHRPALRRRMILIFQRLGP